MNQIQKFIEHLKCGLIVDHGVAEFTVATSDAGEVTVAQVSALSDAYRRGLRPGAEVLSFAGRLLTSANDFQNVLGIFPEGTRLPLTWRDRDGLHEATIRLRPLHAFQKAPELPEERRQQPPEDPEKHDGEESHADKPASEVPKSLKSLFVARDGFCNYHFNEVQRLRLLNALKERVASNGDPEPAWVIAFNAADPGPQLAGELTIAASAVGMNLNNRPFLQSTTAPLVEEESAQLTLTNPPNPVVLLLDSESQSVFRLSPRSLELQNQVTGFAAEASPFNDGPVARSRSARIMVIA